LHGNCSHLHGQRAHCCASPSGVPKCDPAATSFSERPKAYQIVMKRRQFVTALLSVAAIGSAQAQRGGNIYRIALVDPVMPTGEMTEAAGGPMYGALFKELHQRGYFEGHNLLIERFSGEGRAEHYPELARDVVRRNPDLIFVLGQRFLLDFKASTATIPLIGVFTDPVGLGIVTSLSRPGANITGVSLDAGFDIYGKRFELLKELDPKISNVGLLLSRAVWENTPLGAAMQEAARRTGIALFWLSDGPLLEAEYRRAFAAIPKECADALIVSEQAENVRYRRLIVELVEKARLPAIYPFDLFVELGGLMAYGTDLPDLGRHVADVIDHILKGAKPSEIPIYQPTTFRLGINLKTAKALGITVPVSLLVRADEVIE
jgi:putative ABC transport system substrate-binding protein